MLSDMLSNLASGGQGTPGSATAAVPPTAAPNYVPDDAIAQQISLAKTLRNVAPATSWAGVAAQGLGAVGGNLVQGDANNALTNNQNIRRQDIQNVAGATDLPTLAKALINAQSPGIQDVGLKTKIDQITNDPNREYAIREAQGIRMGLQPGSPELKTFSLTGSLPPQAKPEFTTISKDAFGTERKGFVDPITQKVTPYSDPAAGTGIDSALDQSPDDYLKTLPPQVQARVKAIANYQQPPIAGGKGPGNAIMDAVSRYNPTYNASNFPNISAVRKSFTSGQDAANTAAFNLAIQHAQGLLDAEDRLKNGDYGGYNSVRNFARSWGGDTEFQNAASDFSMHRSGLATELDKAFKGAGSADVTGIEDIKRTLGDPNSPPAAVKGAVTAAMKMLSNRITQQRDKYQRGTMTTDEEMPLFSPDSATALDSILGPGTSEGLNATVGGKTQGRLLVPAGFVTDFASVPWFAQSIISVLGRHSVPAILHDYLYWQQKCTREEADLILFDAMDEYHSSWFQKHAVYYAVRVFGGWAWADNAADRKKGLIRILPPDRRELPENLEWETFRQGLLDKQVKEGPDPMSEGVDHPDYCSLGNRR